MIEQYYIPGTSNYQNGLEDSIVYNDPNFWKSFQEDYERCKAAIVASAASGGNLLILRVYDGEFLFLEQSGSGEFWKRTHCSKDLHSIDTAPFFAGVAACDYVCVQLNAEMFVRYNNILGHIRPIDFPMDFIYGLVANKWLFQTFANDIALIGGEYKIRAIKALMNYEQYRSYLGVTTFTDYIAIPERCACDDTEALLQIIGEQLRHSKAKVVLFGIGIGKMAIAHRFRQYKTAAYIDVGFGLTALSGFGDIRRPYYGNWTNYRMRNFDYVDIDKWFCDDNEQNNIVYLD